MSKFLYRSAACAALIGAAALSCGAVKAEPLFAFLTAPVQMQAAPQTFEQAPADESEDTQAAQPAPRLQRQIVDYTSKEGSGTIVIDTPNTFLYYVLGNGKAIRYGIGVGRQGFTWSGIKSVERKTEWPDWYPPAEMIARQPYLPRMVAGGPGNPLGARAMYIGGTEYRIHGTNDPTTIGKRVSSGCIRLTNEDVEDLYSRVQVGAKVIVLPQDGAGQIAQRQVTPERVSSYVPAAPSKAAVTWNAIRPAGLY
jgi:lipoprotein-anchoring transpeptidase ErfK/SrfK